MENFRLKKEGLRAEDAEMLLSLNQKSFVANENYRNRLLYLLGRVEEPHKEVTSAMREADLFRLYYFFNMFDWEKYGEMSFHGKYGDMIKKVIKLPSGVRKEVILKGKYGKWTWYEDSGDEFSNGKLGKRALDKSSVDEVSEESLNKLAPDERYYDDTSEESYDWVIPVIGYPDCVFLDGEGGFICCILKYTSSGADRDDVYRKCEAELQWYYYLGATKVYFIYVSCEGTFFDGVKASDPILVPLDKDMQVNLDEALDWLKNYTLPYLSGLFESGKDIVAQYADIPDDKKELVSQLFDCVVEREKLKVKEEELRAHLLAYMKEVGVYKIGWDSSNITYIDASSSKIFDKTKLFKVHPELNVSEFYKVVRKAEQLRVKIK